jgi:hypothetical protein
MRARLKLEQKSDGAYDQGVSNAAASAVSLEEIEFMCVSECSGGYSILTAITQQRPCQLQTRVDRHF